MTDNSSETTNDQQKMQSGKQTKPIKKLAVILVILFVLSGAVYLSTEFLFHAGGLRRISFITATDYFYSELLTLPLPFREGYNAGNTATFFKSNQSLSELNDRICQISDSTELATELFDDNNLLIKKVIRSGSNNQALFLIQKNNIKRGYYLFNLAADFTDYASPNKGTRAKLIFPYHLVNDVRFAGQYAGFALNTEYATAYTIGDFRQFYESLNIYNLRKTDDTLTIKGYLHDTNLAPGLPAISEPVMISFRTEQGQCFFKVSLS